MTRNSDSHNNLANRNGLKNGKLNGTPSRAAQSGGLTNGLGNGRTNAGGNGHAGDSGMTNGIGRTNGTAEGGRTNGLTNGLSSANGSGGQQKLNPRKSKSLSRKLISLILVLIIVFTLVGSFIVLLPSPAMAKFVDIDGIFSDWDSKVLYCDTAATSDASLDIVNFSVATDNELIYGYLQTRGDLQNKDTVERYMLFVDSDKSSSTGYMVGDIGADYAIEAYGWHNSSWTVQAWRFSGSDQLNWSAFMTIGSGACKSSGNELEFAANIRTTIAPGTYYAKFASASESAKGEICTPKVDGENGALVVTQTPLDSSGIISANNLTTLTLSASGKDVRIHEFHVASSGVPESMISNLGMDMLVPKGTSVLLTITADMSKVSSGTLVKTWVSNVTTSSTVSIAGRGLIAYAHGPSASIAIDGAFADWDGTAKMQETFIPCPNPDIDVTEHAATTQQNSLFAYVGFSSDGHAFGGAVSPVMRTVTHSGTSDTEVNSTGTGASPTLLQKITGEDFTCIYVDSIANHGVLIGGINADFCIEIKGIEGEILSERLFTYPGRVLVSDTDILAESDAHQLEVSVPNDLIGSSGANIYIYIETTDWAHVSDYTAMQSVSQPTASGTRAGLESVDLGTASDFAVLAGSAIPNTGVATIINGDLGLSPATGASITGLTALQVNGIMYVVDTSGPAGSVMNPGLLAAAKNDLTVAYVDARDRTPVPTGDFLDPGTGDIGGLMLVPGLYKFTTTAGISSDVTLNGGSDDVWIFQIGTSLTTGSGIHVKLAGGAQASNIFWQVGTSATIGTGSDFKGTVMADQSITVNTGTMLEGRVLAMVAAVTLDTNTISLPKDIVVINEVMFDPSSGDDWFELYNPTASNYDLSGWTLVDRSESSIYTFPVSTTLDSHAYTRINVSSVLDFNDYLSLLDTSFNIIDFVAWSTSSDPVGANYTAAVAAGEWPSGGYLGTAALLQGDSIGRDQNSTDNNSVSDWDITCGIDATAPTPVTQNLDIPEFQMIAAPALFLLIVPMLAISRRRRMSL